MAAMRQSGDKGDPGTHSRHSRETQCRGFSKASAKIQRRAKRAFQDQIPDARPSWLRTLRPLWCKFDCLADGFEQAALVRLAGTRDIECAATAGIPMQARMAVYTRAGGGIAGAVSAKGEQPLFPVARLRLTPCQATPGIHQVLGHVWKTSLLRNALLRRRIGDSSSRSFRLRNPTLTLCESY
jgi:hypothetical protein